MVMCYVGINYRRAKLAVREQLSFTDGSRLEFLSRAERLGVNQCMILSTCNRSEVFYFTEDSGTKGGHMDIRQLYLDMFPGSKADGYLEELCGEEAIAYLFRITAGLESLVLGEDQILGQVREAFEFSKAVGMTGKELNKVVREAVTLAKRIKTELKVSEKPLSVSYIGIQSIDRCFGIAGRRALVLGSGSTAELAVRYLYDYGAAEVWVCSRNEAHAKRLRVEFPKLGIARFEERYRLLGQSELIISATSAPHPVLLVEKVRSQSAMPRAYLDLAAPRDIDPRIAELPGCILIDMDTLEQVADENRRERERLLLLSRDWIEDAVSETMSWLFESGVDETIGTLQQRCEEIVEDTFGYLNRKLSLEPREQKLLRKMLAASLRRLIREPILELKNLDTPQRQAEYQRVVRELFRKH